jgi:electron transfer flavoprotein alpha subunit
VLLTDAAALRRPVARKPRRTAGRRQRRGLLGIIVAAATTCGKNFMPRVAALLDVAQISEIVAVEAADTFVRPIYAGNVLATVQSSDAIKVITVRTTAFEAAGEGGSATVENLAAAADLAQSKLTGRELTKSERPELTAAKIIVSGGRGMGNGDNFHKLLEPLADKLGRRGGCFARGSRCRLRCPTTIRSARPARSLRHSCTLLSASRERSSIWPE